jgi:hypothetical protein
MTINLGDSQIYIKYDRGGWLRAGETAGPVTWQLEPGEYVIPADTMRKFYQATVSASGCFTGSFMAEPAPVPDGNGWTPRIRWDR